MTNVPVIFDSSRIQPGSFWQRGGRYFWLAIVSYALLAVIVFVYLMRTPVFKSTQSMVLPGSGSSSNFNIESVGQANQATNSAFGNAEFSPLANYQAILKSRDVLVRVADKLELSPKAIRPIKVQLRSRTSIIELQVPAESPEAAQKIGWAYYQAFQEALDILRDDERARRDDRVTEVLRHYNERVSTTRLAIIEFQQRALLVSSDQLGQLMETIANLTDKRFTLVSMSKNNEDFVRQLSLDLGISPAMAGHAFALQSDAAFRGYLQELDQSAAKVAEYSSRWGDNHPKVIAQSLRYDSAREALRKRSKTLVGEFVSDALQTTNLQTSPERATLFADLVSQYATLQGTKAEIVSLDRMLIQLDDRLKVFSREVAELERLEREHALAEAVFTSAAAKLEASRADIFASYPAVQLLSVPSLPEKPTNPNPIIAMAIAAVGFIFISFGLLALWHRSRLIKLVLKNS